MDLLALPLQHQRALEHRYKNGDVGVRYESGGHQPGGRHEDEGEEPSGGRRREEVETAGSEVALGNKLQTWRWRGW